MGDQEAELLRRVRELFDKAEGKLKDLELLQGDLAIPVINELRYAGYHLIRGLDAHTDISLRHEQFCRAAKHCQRAIYDAIEAKLLFYLASIRTFQTDYRLVQIGEVIPDYQLRLDDVRKAQALIGKAKENHEERDSYYEEIEPHLTRVGDVSQYFDVARGELNKKVEAAQLEESRRQDKVRAEEQKQAEEKERRERDERTTARRWRYTFAVAVIAAVTGVAKACEWPASTQPLRKPVDDAGPGP